MPHNLRTITPVYICLLFTACGGGGGGDSGPATTNTPGSGTSGTTQQGTGTTPTSPATTNTGTTGQDIGSNTSSGDSTGSPASSPGNTDGNSASPPDTQTPGFTVDASARFNTPTDITLDGAGNLFVMDNGNQLIRKVSPAGDVTTVPGSVPQHSQIAADAGGNLYVNALGEFYRITPEGDRTTLTKQVVRNIWTKFDAAKSFSILHRRFSMLPCSTIHTNS
jgi:hypothetical protein